MEITTRTPGTDRVRRFIFEKQPVRGHWVRLAEAWRELRAHAHYPQPVEELLGEAVAASVLLAASLKFRGRLTLQLQGNGAVRLLVAQCTHEFGVRALARFDADRVSEPADVVAPGPIFQRLVGSDGRLTVTIETDEQGAPYQGIVPLQGASLGESLETYFASSEQLPTRVLVAADRDGCAGLLVQKMPQPASAAGSEDAWVDAQRGIGRLRAADLLVAPVESLLERGFEGHDLRLFRGSSVHFECRCGEGRVAALLRALGEEEVRDVLKEQGSVTVTCEFCHRPYRFGARDVDALFTGGGGPGAPEEIQ
ncbi:MAG TPA: Hsp33 family molecular chaperone HslO [Steroidobacteraceae bacterium]|jgi:molecular chaperone Hsp33|nr:Hsp33 family molecular chaperone HslO [Steroidobacteraceae bacterium]